MRLSQQEYRSGLAFPPPGDLPNPGIKPGSPALAGEFITTEWLRSKSLQVINAGEGVEKREPSYTVGGNAN